MNSDSEPTVVIVPGLRDHVADHWQTLLAGTLDRVAIVAPLERDRLSLPARVAALDAVLAEIDGPVVLVAHSAGVLITVHWAQQSDRPVHGALLATPPDFETPLPPGYRAPRNWRPTAGRRSRGGGCRSGASWPRAAPTPSRQRVASRAWPRCGGADWSTSAMSAI